MHETKKFLAGVLELVRPVIPESKHRIVEHQAGFWMAPGVDSDRFDAIVELLLKNGFELTQDDGYCPGDRELKKNGFRISLYPRGEESFIEALKY